VNALVDELGLLGRVSVTPLDGGRSALIIMTHESLDDIVAICSFVLDPDDLKIFEAPPLTPEQRAIEAPSAPASRTSRATASSIRPTMRRRRSAELSDDERGYGFFQPIEQIRRDWPASSPRRRRKHGRARGPGSARALAEKKAAKRPRSHGRRIGSIRVSVEKVDQLINLVGELVITQAMIEQRSERARPDAARAPALNRCPS
jgi:two-component system chemotaxis sensor kinase CheA